MPPVKQVKDAYRALKENYEGKTDKRSLEKMAAINYAYKVLSTPIDRRTYDADRFGDKSKFGTPKTKDGKDDERYVYERPLTKKLVPDKRFN
ncbi:hypothetical protein H9P43_005130 [Blastocladiella emersonii ATCC 22665]|nr:hypothetical protein H9P43_005130 [Blastocladiella emersonii ATCC 22665]